MGRLGRQSTETRPNEFADLMSLGQRILMLPHAYYRPSPVAKLTIRIRVPGAIGLDLPAPPISVGLRPGGMLRAPMPEAPIHEDR